MRKLVLKLTGSGAVRSMVKALRLHLLADWWLRRFPVVKILPGSNIRYRARLVESLGLSVEMFDQDALYAESALPTRIRTFADLGCNVGYFTCLLCHRAKSTKLKGLMLDGNPVVIEDARWHVEANELRDVHVLHGLAGAGEQGSSAEFFMHTSSVCSTTAPPDGNGNSNATWKRVQVPCVRVGEAWHKYFGDEPCDLLKLDIEGSEMDFFRAEQGFLERVQAILLEWHKWRVSLDEIKEFLGQRGFSLKQILDEGTGVGTAIFTQVRVLR